MTTSPIISLDSVTAENTPPRFHLLTKPSGSTCNLDCTYCFFLSKEALYPNAKIRMSEATLEAYIKQLLESQRTPTATVAWQGGEPTLMGLDFYRKSIEFVEKYRRPDQEIEYTFQTNGVLLDDEWCAFLKEHNFLVGLSVDGTQEMHDTYRLNKGGEGTFQQVMRGHSFLRKHGVEFNILCTVNVANQHHGRKVYRFFRDELDATWMQFIPIVERATLETLPIANQGWSERPGGERLLYTQTGNMVTERSVGGEQYGRFLVDIYEEWIRHDVGDIHVQLFDVTLHAYFGEYLLCIHAPTCGYGPALEHNGD
ncbi:MAG: radical SAM protein, partial [Candidatus Promineifilaceae bacterium]